MSSPHPSTEPQLTDPKSVLLSALPPLKAAVKVLRAADPLTAAGAGKHSWFGSLIALLILMLLAMLVMLAGDSAPFVDPVTSLWTNKFEFNVTPTLNWPVLVKSGLCVVFACMVSYLTSYLAGWQLNDWKWATRKNAVRLARFAGLATALAYLVVLLLISVLGWILYLLKFRIFFFGWMTMGAVVLLPFTTWGIAKVFRRTSLPQKSSILPPLAISVATIITCATGAVFIMDGLTQALLKQGRTVNSARNTPTAAVVQTCAKATADIVCAVTLFPTKWQDYELIGEWKLGSVNSDGTHKARFYWHPAKETDRQFAFVTLGSRKEVTVEIRIDATLICKTGNTNISNDDKFFLVQGRVLGEQHNSPQEMRLRIDNTDFEFVKIMKQVCSLKADA